MQINNKIEIIKSNLITTKICIILLIYKYNFIFLFIRQKTDILSFFLFFYEENLPFTYLNR